MATTVINLNDDASKVVRYLMDPDILENRISVFEQVTDMLLEAAQGILDADEHQYLKLIGELRFLIRDFRTISNSLKNIDYGKEGNEEKRTAER